MGLSSIPGNQLFERLFLWLQFDPKTYPRLPYVTRTTTRQLHLFTFIQFMCLAILYGLKAVKQTAMVFPFFIALLVFVRKGLVKYFSKEELEVLDAEEDLPPDAQPKEPETKAKEEKKFEPTEESSDSTKDSPDLGDNSQNTELTAEAALAPEIL